jgi:hypothetical protein
MAGMGTPLAVPLAGTCCCRTTQSQLSSMPNREKRLQHKRLALPPWPGSLIGIVTRDAIAEDTDRGLTRLQQAGGQSSRS